ncbi:hypothetical protein IE81DRAFT_290166 [Ceraceosorus guamensis]|uniref:Ubiquitin-like protease family profile domain-containing protein n=1 Tax=Ceraceosorus guamensis TaxID=1522189 RepID=A0A316VXS4_9BASI|nr:hypothetical protein IE81DRAFT_290166 [Ceraceosorus guamensis]PWN42457.1 hypothetical protein IE81DRAFT_290166 [Ceraceosorus guamensis]
MEVSIGSESNADSQAHENPPAKPRELVKRLRYPQDRPGAVDVYNEDIAKLAEGEFLNDTIIELGLKVLHEEIRKRDSELADSIHIFSSFFYKRLTSTAPRDYSRAYELVRKWAKVSIFTKKYLVLPINESLHWYLAIVVNPSYAVDEGRIAAMYERPSDPEREPEGATVLVFDSLAGKHTKVTKDLTNYMKYTWLEQTGKWQEEAKRTDVSGPKQPNYCDCGLFVLHYFERFFSDPDKFCQDVIPSRQRDHEEWKKEEIELGRRQHWRDKIEELAQAWESKERETLEQRALANALKKDADKAAKESEDATRQAAEAMDEMEVDDAMQE